MKRTTVLIHRVFPSLIFLSVGVSFTTCLQQNQQKQEKANRPLTMCAPIVADTAWYSSGKKAPLFEGLDILHFPITTDKPLAQRYFDQGLALAYGFNHAEAARSFYYAIQLDPECAMCYWGYAYVLGPNYNAGMEEGNYERAYKAIQKAIKYADDATKKEKVLVQAMAKRYPKNAVEDRMPYDKAYAYALKNVLDKFPNDPDINAMYAEALMDLHPWDIWSKNGEPREWTPEIMKSLNKALDIDPRHIGANHFYIHAVEASKTPEKAYISAYLFDEGLAPGAGHLVHMPSHIYIRTGDYHKGSMANLRAIKVDSLYVTSCNAQGVYPLVYMPHNYHFLAACASLAGNSERAMEAAEEMSREISLVLMDQPEWKTLQHYYIIPYYVYVKFGKWNKILSMNVLNPELVYPQAIRHYARGMAHLGKGKTEQAKWELAKLKKISNEEAETLKEVTIWQINTTYDLVQIAIRVLEGEILAAEGNYDKSIGLLKEAVAIEDKLNYQEPPDWFFSVRHHLGAVQIEAGKYEEALATYREDLETYPKNGWALFGLYQSLKLQGKEKEAEKAKQKFEQAWRHADTKLKASRIL